MGRLVTRGKLKLTYSKKQTKNRSRPQQCSANNCLTSNADMSVVSDTLIQCFIPKLFRLMKKIYFKIFVLRLKTGKLNNNYEITPQNHNM